MPEVVVSVLGDSAVSGAAGGAATLACEARYSPPPRALPLPPLDIRWQKGEQPISLQVPILGLGGLALCRTCRYSSVVFPAERARRGAALGALGGARGVAPHAGGAGGAGRGPVLVPRAGPRRRTQPHG